MEARLPEDALIRVDRAALAGVSDRGPAGEVRRGGTVDYLGDQRALTRTHLLREPVSELFDHRDDFVMPEVQNELPKDRIGRRLPDGLVTRKTTKISERRMRAVQYSKFHALEGRDVADELYAGILPGSMMLNRTTSTHTVK